MKPTLETVEEPYMAWVIWKALQRFSDLLWERYKKDFQELSRMEGFLDPHTHPNEELPLIDFEDHEEGGPAHLTP